MAPFPPIYQSAVFSLLIVLGVDLHTTLATELPSAQKAVTDCSELNKLIDPPLSVTGDGLPSSGPVLACTEEQSTAAIGCASDCSLDPSCKTRCDSASAKLMKLRKTCLECPKYSSEQNWSTIVDWNRSCSY